MSKMLKNTDEKGDDVATMDEPMDLSVTITPTEPHADENTLLVPQRKQSKIQILLNEPEPDYQQQQPENRNGLSITSLIYQFIDRFRDTGCDSSVDNVEAMDYSNNNSVNGNRSGDDCLPESTMGELEAASDRSDPDPTPEELEEIYAHPDFVAFRLRFIHK